MQYRLLGRTGVKVSPLCFGVMSFGGDADEKTSATMYALCRRRGINFFDTANVYSHGRSEQILGRLIAAERDEIVLTSKVNGSMGADVNQRGLSRRHITQAVEASLKRLGTDRLDLYFVHSFDAETPIDETLAALDDLVRQGKILYPAVSNWAAWQIAKSLGISARKGLARFACIQPMYNLVKRQAEVEILPLAKEEELGVISYSPLGGGLLTGKYGVGKRPEGGRILETANYSKRYAPEEYYQVADRFSAYAQERGIHPATLAVAWVKAHPGITAPIIGARNPEQLQPSLDALELDLDAAEYAAISDLSPEPPLATDRLEERG
jgi:aryl-alcohol dehydrogenase-like predicted oxidoreductase